MGGEYQDVENESQERESEMPEVRERTNGYVCGIVHGGGILLHCGCLTLLALPPRTRTVLLQTSQWC